MLHKNDVTFIKYTNGGFFEEHEDYLSVTSNILEEFTMIICVDSNLNDDHNQYGGQTIIKINDNFEHKSLSTITPKHSLLFRKDLRHKSVKINKKDGYKHIITLNLWAFNKNDHYNKPIVIVKFPNSSIKYYNSPVIISAKNIKSHQNTKLYQHFYFGDFSSLQIRTKNTNNNNNKSVFKGLGFGKNRMMFRMNDSKLIYEYEEKELPQEIYSSIFYKIYNRMYINIVDYNKYKKEILSFGFEEKNILIDYVPKSIDNHPIKDNSTNTILEEMKNNNGHSIYLTDNIENQIFI